MGQAEDIAADMFAERAGSFESVASRVYDTARMAETFRAEFDATLADVDVAPLLSFFASDLGRQIVSLELSAREAMIDPEIEEAADRRAHEGSAAGHVLYI